MRNREIHHTFYKSSYSLFFQFIINDGTYPFPQKQMEGLQPRAPPSFHPLDWGLSLFFWLVFSLTRICSGIYKGEKREIQPIQNTLNYFTLNPNMGSFENVIKLWTLSPEIVCPLKILVSGSQYTKCVSRLMVHGFKVRPKDQINLCSQAILDVYEGPLKKVTSLKNFNRLRK